ncbi:MAG: substrate-binding domain-containing protein [Rubrobacteraceae bacterium]
MLGLSGCGGAGTSPARQGGGVGSEAAQRALEELRGKVLSTGPYGEEPTPASEIKLSDEELEQIRAKGATAAIALHYGGNDWAKGQVDGLRSQFGEMGIEVIAVTDATFDPDKQVSDIETTLIEGPDIMVSIPTDGLATADAYGKAVAQGVKLVFMDNVPVDFEHGEDYVSVVSADNYGNGVASAHLMALKLGGRGRIGLVYHSVDFFVTKQRYEGFKKILGSEYKDIEIVEERGVIGPDFAGEALLAASAMLTKHADLDGIWAVWDVPAEGVLAAARTVGRTGLIVTTIDLGEPVAISMASGGMVKGLGSQRPFDQGVTEAKLAGYGLLDKEAPPYVALSALPVTEDNVLDAWRTAYHEAPPEKVREVAE